MTLVLGGIKSGKTGFSEKKAEEVSQKNKYPVIYLATAQALDDEMKLRIRRHRESRPSHWITVEAPLDILMVFDEPAAQKQSVILFDCLTMWITNLLMELGEGFEKGEAESYVLSKLRTFLDRAEKYPGEIIIISNQVEAGLVSPHFLGRTFQDIAGISHQVIAQKADQVVLMTAGLPMQLK